MEIKQHNKDGEAERRMEENMVRRRKIYQNGKKTENLDVKVRDEGGEKRREVREKEGRDGGKVGGVEERRGGVEETHALVNQIVRVGSPL